MKNQQGNTLVIVIIVILILLIAGYFVFTKILLPKAVNKIVDTTVTNTVNELNFDNAQSFQVNQDLSQNEGMFLQMGINKGKIMLNGDHQDDKLTGEIKYLGNKPSYDFQTGQEKLGIFTIKSDADAGESANLHLSQKTNGRIDIGLGAGSVDLDLTNLNIPILNVAAGAGAVNIIFPKEASVSAQLAAGVGKMNLSVYKGSGIKITTSQSFNMNLGDAYEKVGDAYQTKGYEQAKVKIDLSIGQALGGFNLQEI